VDNLLLKTPAVAVMQVKKEVEYMAEQAQENLKKSLECMFSVASDYAEDIAERERVINFTNKAVTRFLIQLSPLVDAKDERRVGAYFHVLNDLERIGDHAENFGEIAVEMQEKGLAFSQQAQDELKEMEAAVLRMFEIAAEAFDDSDSTRLGELAELENKVDNMKRELTAKHYARLAEGICTVDHSPYYTSMVVGLERVADHLINVGYSILNPTGSQSETKKIEDKDE
jgi:phosphate:Na+ symporter